MRQALGLTQDWPTVVVGAGNLGRALANYAGFSERGFPVVGVLDADPAKVGTVVGSFRVRPVDDLAELVAGHESLIGIIATPPARGPGGRRGARGNGVTAILNFAPAYVAVPEGVAVRKVDLALELQILVLLPTPAGRAPAAGRTARMTPACPRATAAQPWLCLALTRRLNEAWGHRRRRSAPTSYRCRPDVVIYSGP